MSEVFDLGIDMACLEVFMNVKIPFINNEI